MSDTEKSIDYSSPIDEDFQDPNWDEETKFEEKVIKPEFILIEGNEKIESFYISNIPVTQELYLKVMAENPSDNIGIKNPVENVSWFDAILFCNKLSNLKNIPPYYNIEEDKVISHNELSKGYRLPTKKEWIFAAVCGNKKEQHIFSGSNDISEVGWFNSNSSLKTKSCGQKKTNSIGLYDMSGNIWEWTADKKKETVYVCGGSAKSAAEECEILQQGNFTYPANTKNPFIGFRLVKSY